MIFTRKFQLQFTDPLPEEKFFTLKYKSTLKRCFFFLKYCYVIWKPGHQDPEKKYVRDIGGMLPSDYINLHTLDF